jgi:type II secretory pathway component GspD/PulD (secretin)
MHPRVNIFLTAAAFVSVAFSQQAQADRVLHFTSTGTQQAVGEIATVIRSISDIKQTSFDAKENALVLHGTASQMALAEWLFPLLDLPTSDLAVTQQRQKATKHEYQVDPDDVLRVFYLSNTATVQSFQEVATAVRSLLGIRRMFTYNALKAIVARGSAEQAAAAEFVFNEMDKPAISTDSSSAIPHTHSPEFRMRITEDNIVRVFYLPNTKTVMDFQMLATLVRTATDVRWMFTYNAARAVAARGNEERLALATWLFNELDEPTNVPQDSGPHEYRIPSASDDVTRIFRLPPPVSGARLNEISNRIRPITPRRIALPYPPNNAIVVRATAGQIALAEQFIKEQ